MTKLIIPAKTGPIIWLPRTAHSLDESAIDLPIDNEAPIALRNDVEIEDEYNAPVLITTRGEVRRMRIHPDQLRYLAAFDRRITLGWDRKSRQYRPRIFYRGHRYEVARLLARTPKDSICHHANSDTLDNHQANLRNVTRSENTRAALRKDQDTGQYAGHIPLQDGELFLSYGDDLKAKLMLGKLEARLAVITAGANYV